MTENVPMFKASQVAAALGLEINSGLKFGGGSVMNLAKKYCGSPKRTKRGVLVDYVAWIKEQVPGYEPTPSVTKAMGK